MAASISGGVAGGRSIIGKLTPSTTAMLLCDIQERFRPLIYNSNTIIHTAQFITSLASALDIPIVATQQYTKVFGPTVSDCFVSDDIRNKTPIFEKKLFSMITPEVKSHIQTLGNDGDGDGGGLKSFVLVGIEAHVCVQQTALDLLEMGHDVHIIVDGVSSQQPLDRQIALQRLAGAGAFLTTAQSLAFMLMKTAEHPNFKTVSKLVVNHMKLPNEFNDVLIKNQSKEEEKES